MTVRLRPMTDAEIAEWLPGSADTFVEQRSRNGDTPEHARTLADRAYAHVFPDGSPRGPHEVLAFEADGERVGVAWVGPMRDRPDDPASAWLFDFSIDESHRGRGHGRAAITLLQEYLAGRGVTQLGLNVFGDNVTARHLYARAGFREAAVTMTKRLPAPKA